MKPPQPSYPAKAIPGHPKDPKHMKKDLKSNLPNKIEALKKKLIYI